MGIEIERKFRVKDNRWREGVTHSELIQQGYLAGADAIQAGFVQCSVRIRRAGDQAWINVKSANKGIARQEFEYPIPVEDAVALFKLTKGLVSKVRHHVPVKGVLSEVVFEVDEFQDDNAGLVVAEVELPSEDAVFPVPHWLGREVSDEGRYYNINLITHPFRTWSPADRDTVA